jgi:hypothetical protein
MIKKIVKAILIASGTLFSLQALQVKNAWDRSFMAIPVYNTGISNTILVQSGQTMNISTNGIQVLFLIAYDIRRHGAGVRGDWYHCETDAFMKEKITGTRLTTTNEITVNHDSKEVDGKRQDFFVLSYK